MIEGIQASCAIGGSFLIYDDDAIYKIADVAHSLEARSSRVQNALVVTVSTICTSLHRIVYSFCIAN